MTLALCTHDGAAALSVCPHCLMVVPRASKAQARGRVRNTPTKPATGTRKKTAAKPVPAKPAAVPATSFVPVAFFVPGEPVTQGSMKSIGRGRIAHVKGPELTAWRTTIAAAARAAGATAVGDHQAVKVEAMFWLTRPVSVKRPFPSAKSDVDKLSRALFDALSGVAYEDDGQVVTLVVDKRYADDKHPAGVWVQVSLVSDLHA